MAARTLEVTPNPVVAAMAPYTGATPDPLIELKLDSNESSSPLPALATAAERGWLPHRYMRTGALETRLAARLGIASDRVLVTAGADDALERAIRAVCAPGREAIFTLPTFEVLERYVRLAGATWSNLSWWRDDFPVAEVLERASENTVLVAVISPNNPTGAVASRRAVHELAERLPRALILVDHAYVEYGDPEDDLTGLTSELPNLLVLRTFSKAWSAAGLRVGYAVGDPTMLRWMRTLGQPYPVSAPSLAMATHLLETSPTPPAQRLERVRSYRRRLAGVLEALGIEALPSKGNFVLARVGDACWVRRALVSLGVGVRAFPGRPGLEQWLRFTAPEDEAASDRLEDALRTVLAPEAILLDMDGVLADVSASYREAIRRTAADFGVAVTAADIARLKAAGNANNDWELTRSLLAEAGVEARLDEVASRFESHYRGSDEVPGLWRNERPLLSPAELERASRGRPLAVVTGRPRADATRFLADHGLARCVGALVTMDDAPLKPDPAPVRLALERLGVRRAWMVGDTPDDLVAARAAGVLPIGVRAPGSSLTPDDALLAAGAARVLGSLRELEDLLP